MFEHQPAVSNGTGTAISSGVSGTHAPWANQYWFQPLWSTILQQYKQSEIIYGQCTISFEHFRVKKKYFGSQFAILTIWRAFWISKLFYQIAYALEYKIYL
jgi:hypothetical protein